LSSPFAINDSVDVRRHPRHDPAGHLALVEVEREPLQLRPHPHAQGQHDSFGGATGDEGRGYLVEQVDDRDAQIGERCGEQHRLGAVGDS
jgi:hypothetical protein